MTEVTDFNGHIVIVPVHLEGRSGRNKVNAIKSFYGKENFERWGDRQVKEGLLLYVNKKKAESSHMTRWLHLHAPGNNRASVSGVKKFGSDTTILAPDDTIKPEVKYRKGCPSCIR